MRKKNYFQKVLARKAVFIALVFVCLFSANVVLAGEKDEIIRFEIKKEDLSPNSPFLNSKPRIDTEAAMTEKNAVCRSLPESWWVVLLAAYVFLLIFNLAYEFEKTRKKRWFWEAFYTLLAVLAWKKFDGCDQYVWFVQSVLINGFIIYSFYLYYLNKASKKHSDTA